MGCQVKASCNCGYENTVSVGGSKLKIKTVEYFPHYCNNCRDIVDVNIRSGKPICGICTSTQITSYNDERIQKTPGNNEIIRSIRNIINDGFYLCPRCNNQ